MLVLVLADNLLLLYLGWEGVGLCSYLLIGFWYSDPVNGSAGRKGLHRHARRRHRDGDRPVPALHAPGHARHPDADAARGRAVAGRLRAADRRRGAAARRRGRQVGAAAAADLAARRDGRPDAGQRADPRGDDGDGGRLPDRAHARAVHARPAGAARRRDHRRRDAAAGRLQRPHAARHQARARVFDDQPDRLHVPRARRRRLVGGDLPFHDARLLQGAAVPRRRRRDHRARTTSTTCSRWAACAASCRSRSGRS